MGKAVIGRYLVALISLVGRPARGVGEDVGLRVLIGPELLLSGLQHSGGLHHVLLPHTVVEPLPQQAGVEPVLIPGDTHTPLTTHP